ncbi:MAG: right-handed parallel beta-helix repeat-containing protein [Saprospiraceae bacterium]
MRTCLLILLLILPTVVQARIIKVCSDCSISSLGEAIELANDGDEIRLLSGFYKEYNLSIKKRLSIVGIDHPIIDGDQENEILIIEADSVLIEGITFQNSGKSQIKDLAAIRVKRHDYFTIRNNRIIDAFFGVFIENGRNGVIENNYLISKATNEMSSGNAIHCWYASGLTIKDNKIYQYRDGIYLEFVDQTQVINNFSEGNIRYGLHFMFSNDNLYHCNTFMANGAGVAVMFSKRIQMLENTFKNNWGRSAYALLLKEIYDAEIKDNLFEKNTIGILLEGSTRLEYQNNTFIHNGWAIQMSGGCLDNTFTKNNFLFNTLDLVVKSRMNNNTFNGNYWSEYTGYDLDKDGIGDIPHRPVKLFSYILEKAPESIILLRSFFVDLLNFSEKVSPVFTPENVLDLQPLIQTIP